MNEFDPGDRPRGIDEGFEPQNRSGTGRDRPMILLDNIVQILAPEPCSRETIDLVQETDHVSPDPADQFYTVQS